MKINDSLVTVGLLTISTYVYAGTGDLAVDGNLTVGTPTSTYKLHVNGGPAMFSNELYSNGVWTTSFGPRNGGNDIIFKNYDGMELARITHTGKFGIGTSTPYDSLTVKGSYPNVSTNGTNYNKGINIEAFNLPIAAGMTDSGYRVGIGVQNFTNDSNFKGTLKEQIGVWSRVGSNSTSPTGNINNSYALYLENLDGGATVGNKYGLYQKNPTAKNFFAGNLGIGTEDPGNFKLNVMGNTKLGRSTGIGRSGTHYDEIAYNTGFSGENNSYQYLTNDTAASIRLGYHESIEFRTAPTGYAGNPINFIPRMRLDAGGLDVYGPVKSNGSSLTSDVKFKKNLQPIIDPLKKLSMLNGLSYEWKTEEYKDQTFPVGRHYGVIAQEIEKVLPEVVTTAPDGTKSVAYTEIIPVLIEAIKEQQKIIEEQRKIFLDRIEKLERLATQ